MIQSQPVAGKSHDEAQEFSWLHSPLTWILCAVLFLGTVAAYWPVSHASFVGYDDPFYITDNDHVKTGMNWENFKWAWHATVAANWHPLTLLSHMLDCQWFGLDAGRHHLMNLLFHSVNSCLLFALVLGMTSRLWPSFIVAALFAWHPMHVESVAWVAERKDVLSTFFGFLTLLAYARYVQQSKPRLLPSKAEHPLEKANVCYALALLCFVLGLLAKPMLVTLPFVMLLLDYWPLQRVVEINPETGARKNLLRRRLLEKTPFFALTAISCAVTLWAQKSMGAVVSVQHISLQSRIANAVLSYYKYVGKLVWPRHLAVLYTYHAPALSWLVIVAALGLIVCCALALRLKKWPYVAVGLFWFLGMLVPVIGLVQVGWQAMADRYSYLPSIGLFLAVTFGLADVWNRFGRSRTPLATAAFVSLSACLALTFRQAETWHDGVSLFRHAVEVNPDSSMAYNGLAGALFGYERKEEAIASFQQAIQLRPDYADAHLSLGRIYGTRHEFDKAIPEFEAALKIDPKLEGANYFLADALLSQRDIPGALQHYLAELAINPNHARSHLLAAGLLEAQNQPQEASRHFSEAVRLDPNRIEALNDYAWLLATNPDPHVRDGRKAVELANRAVSLAPSINPSLLDTLAAAQAEAGHYDDAVKTAQKALRIVQNAGVEQLAREIEQHLDFYQQQKPFHQSPVPNAAPVANQ